MNQRVEVTWHDAHSGAAEGWTDPAELDANPYVVQTVGWLIPHASPGHITVASSHSSAGMVDGVTVIPLGMVKTIHALSPAVVLPLEPVDENDVHPRHL